jgi:hypothetical protein
VPAALRRRSRDRRCRYPGCEHRLSLDAEDLGYVIDALLEIAGERR